METKLIEAIAAVEFERAIFDGNKLANSIGIDALANFTKKHTTFFDSCCIN